jgi:hypothetical protein
MKQINNLMRFALLLFIASFVVACSQAPEKKTPPAEKQQQSYEPSSKSNRYKPPDGGFGTLDDSRETRKEVNDQGKEAEKAVDETQ